MGGHFAAAMSTPHSAVPFRPALARRRACAVLVGLLAAGALPAARAQSGWPAGASTATQQLVR